MTAVSDTIFHDTSQKIFSLVKQLDNSLQSKKLEDKVWEAFCLSTDNAKTDPPARKVFKRHPKKLQNYSNFDSSEDNDSLVQLHMNARCIENYKSETSTASSSSLDSFIMEKPTHPFLAIEPNNNQRLSTNRRELYKKPSVILEEIESSAPPVRKKPARHTRIKTAPDGKIKKKCLVEQHPLVSPVPPIVAPTLSKTTIQPKIPARKPKKQNQSPVRDYNIDKKLRTSIEKICMTMDNIRILAETGIAPPDGAEDLARRKQRAVEFSSRFSRVYLYQIGRQIAELHKLMKPQSGRNSNRQTNVHQKLLMTHQIILQAYQAYHHHMPSSIAIGVPEKLKELIKQTTNLCEVHKTILNSSSFEADNKNQEMQEIVIRSVENQCKSLHDRIQESCELTSNTSLLQSNMSKLTLLGYSIPKRAKLFHKKNLNSRLSMYTGDNRRENEYWKKALATLAYKKFNVQSRYKTATFKHRPPIAKTEQVEKIKLEKKPSVGSIIHDKMKPMNDDKILTMVEAAMDKGCVDSEDGLKEAKQWDFMNSLDIKNDLLKPVVRTLFMQFCEENKEMTQTEFEVILKNLLEMVQNENEQAENEDKTKVQDLLISKLDEELKNSIEKVEAAKAREGEKNQQDKKKPKRRQTITISGEKNAKLICICDEDSVVETSEHSNAVSNKKTPNSKPVNNKSLNSAGNVKTYTVTRNTNNIKNKNNLDNIRSGNKNQINKNLVSNNQRNNNQTNNNQSVNNDENNETKDDKQNNNNNLEIANANTATLMENKNIYSLLLPYADRHHQLTGDTSNDLLCPIASSITVTSSLDREMRSLYPDKTSKTSIKISRLPKKSYRKLSILPKDYALQVIQYKLEYNKFTKGNHMYQKSLNIQPWVLTGQIGDLMLEHLLLSVTREIEINEILETLYQSEFQ